MTNLIIKDVSLYHVDRDTDTMVQKNISVNDAKDYIEELTHNMISKSAVREYKVKSDPNPVIYQISKLITSFDAMCEASVTASLINSSTENLTPSSSISGRLLHAQKTAQDKYKTITKIKKGSIIQSLLENNNEYIYVLALIEHSSFIDELDLRRKTGLPESAKATLKTARIHLNKDLSIKNIYLSDSSSKIAEYWYDSFLDLTECINNISNTKHSYNFIKGILTNKLSKKYKQDHLEYVQGLNSYFRHQKSFNFDDCLDFIFSTDPISNEINISELKTEIITKRNKIKTFDTIFEVDITDIKQSLKNNKYTLNTNVELKIKTSDAKIKDSVYTYRLDNGKLILAICNVDTSELQRFNFNQIRI